MYNVTEIQFENIKLVFKKMKKLETKEKTLTLIIRFPEKLNFRHKT